MIGESPISCTATNVSFVYGKFAQALHCITRIMQMRSAVSTYMGNSYSGGGMSRVADAGKMAGHPNTLHSESGDMQRRLCA